MRSPCACDPALTLRALLAATLLAPAIAQAGWLNHCADPPALDAVQHDRVFRFSALVRGVLDQSGHRLALIARAGTDLRRFGQRYLDRLYTPGEIEYCLRSEPDTARRLAARFAAKEATLKVLRPDAHWLDWRSIEVVKMPGGWCELALHGTAQQLRAAAGIGTLTVSLSHEQNYALAVVGAAVGFQTPPC